MRDLAHILNRRALRTFMVATHNDDASMREWARDGERNELSLEDQQRYQWILGMVWVVATFASGIVLTVIFVGTDVLGVAPNLGRAFAFHGLGLAAGICLVGAADAMWRYTVIAAARSQQERTHGTTSALSLRLVRMSRAAPWSGLVGQVVAGAYGAYRL